MRTEIIRQNSDLKRQVWTFLLLDNIANPSIYFDYYSVEERPTTRHKWKATSWWARLDKRHSIITDPPIPADVENEMRQNFQNQIMNIQVTR